MGRIDRVDTDLVEAPPRGSSANSFGATQIVDRDPRGRLPRDGVERYAASGWVAVPGFFTANEIAGVAAWTDALLAAPEVAGTPMVYGEQSRLAPARRIVQRIENFCPFHDGFDALIREGALIASVEALAGDPVVLFKEKINFKMPGGAGFELHQDQQAGWSRYAPSFVTAMVSIDATTIANGCLEIEHGARRCTLAGPEWEPLRAEAFDCGPMGPITTAPGDVLFFDSYVVHASAPNATSSARRVLYVTYNRAVDGDHRARYYADKRASFPPDVERQPGVDYRFRV